MRASEKLQRALMGAVAGAAVWMLLAQLGIPHIVGVGDEGGMVPAAALGFSLGLTALNRLPVYAALLLLALTVAVAYTPVSVRPSRSLIRSDPIPPSADAVVSLSAGITGDGYLSHEGTDRILSALALVKRGVSPRLVVTQERREVGRRTVASSLDQSRIAYLAGVPEVITTRRVRSTHDEAVLVSQIARARGWSHVIVVTSPFHTRRACRTFEKVGLSVSCVPSESRDIAVRDLSLPGDRLRAFSMLLYEAAGTLRYRQKGWL